MNVYLKIKSGSRVGHVKKLYEQGRRIAPVDEVARVKMVRNGYAIFPDKCPDKIPDEHAKIMLKQNPHLLSKEPTPIESLVKKEERPKLVVPDQNMRYYHEGDAPESPVVEEENFPVDDGEDPNSIVSEVDIERMVRKEDFQKSPEDALTVANKIQNEGFSQKKTAMGGLLRRMGYKVVVPATDEEYIGVVEWAAAQIISTIGNPNMAQG